MRVRPLLARVSVAVVLGLGAACGTSVDLGGGAPAGPSGSDGAPVQQCGVLVGPEMDAGCRACSASSSDCQPNGCYGGYWCDTTTKDCGKPPSSCP